VNFFVTVLGSGSTLPTSKRKPTAQYVDCGNRHILIDCGEGTQAQMRSYGVKFQSIDHILISHLHGDHYFGLVGLLSTMNLLGRVKPIAIYGPVRLQEIIELQLNNDQSQLSFDVAFHVLNPKSSGLLFEDKIIRLDNFPLSHRIPASGFLITEKKKERKLNVRLAERDKVQIAYYKTLKKGQDVVGNDGKIISFEKYTEEAPPARTYAFCSDTKYYEKIIPYIEGVDLLYHEATYIEKHKARAKATKHSTAKQAALIAKKAKVKCLLIGHISARYETGEIHLSEAKSVFKNTILAEDGATYSM
jgi:ribonuclease Z